MSIFREHLVLCPLALSVFTTEDKGGGDLGKPFLTLQMNLRDQRDNTVGKVFALHEADLGLILGISYAPPDPAGKGS